MSRNSRIPTPPRPPHPLRAGVHVGLFLAGALCLASPQNFAQAQIQYQLGRPLRPLYAHLDLGQRPLQQRAQNIPPRRRLNRKPQPTQPAAAAPPAQPAAKPAPGPQAEASQTQQPIQQRPAQPAAQQQRPSPAAQAPVPLVTPNRPGQTQLHLPGWMAAHSNLPLAEQQRALENEPGFRNLPPLEQQQLHQRLALLNQMPEEQRRKVLERNELMERLPPAQRQQVRGAMAAVGSLPEDRQHAVGRAFYQVRDMPPAQRQTYINSPQFRAQFNEQERGAINGLLEITPIWPPIQAHPPPTPR